jgi:branched-chain amino acid transport system ATP-binding protein
MTGALLEVDRLTAGYGKVNVLHAASLALHQGELLGIIGPNGHGKSTLMRAISGLVRARDGEIRLSGQRINNCSPETIVARGLVQIPQGDLIFPEMTVADNLWMGAYLPAAYRARIQSRDRVVGLFPRLGERMDQVASTLSGGERRMLAIGRALMSGADILLIDEPSLGLAPLVIEQIFDAIAALKDEGKTILLVEENPSRIEMLADRIALIHHGTVEWSGTPAEMLAEDRLMASYLGE